MNSRERVKRTLTFDHPDRPPRHLWCLPGTWMYQRPAIDAIEERYPSDFAGPAARYGDSGRARGRRDLRGSYIDEWGCHWVVLEDGVIGEVKQPVLATLDDVRRYSLPWELLRDADLSQVDREAERSERFVLAGTQIRPFERMQFLRGTSELMIDLLNGTPEVMQLLDALHAFYLEEATLWSRTAVDGVSFMDDWGSQRALLINPELWRGVFKPLYRDYCEILRGAGKFIFMHSDGMIEAIYPDLIEMGVHALNSQLFCMDIEELGRRHRGQITFWGEIDRQRILPFGTPDEVRQAVRRVHAALASPAGGVIAQCEFGKSDPPENIEAVFEEWDRLCVGIES